MALTKKQKVELGQEYKKYFSGAKNVVIIRQTGISVNDMNEVRKGLFEAKGEYKVVKKRVLLKSLEGENLDMISLDDMQGSVGVLCSFEDEFAPLKVVADVKKQMKKDKKEEGGSLFEYVGGWFDGKRHDGAYVGELANIPSREELISKLLYLIKYPIQSLAVVVSEIAKKSPEGATVGDVVESATKEADVVEAGEVDAVEKGEASVDEVKESVDQEGGEAAGE